MSRAISTIIELWRAEMDLHLLPGLFGETVAATFQSLGRSVSADVLFLYSLCGGMKSENEEDRRFFCFWPLEAAAASTEMILTPYFAFGDGLTGSHRYSFRLESSEISSVYGDYSDGTFTRLAESVDEFFLLLHQAPKRLWLP